MLPFDSPTLASVLPLSLPAFFASYFNNRMVRLNHTETALDPAALWSVENDLPATLVALLADDQLRAKSDAFEIKGGAGGQEKVPFDPSPAYPDEPPEELA